VGSLVHFENSTDQSFVVLLESVFQVTAATKHCVVLDGCEKKDY